MLDKTVDQRKRLDQARTDLETIDAALIALSALKAEASKSAAAYAEWRADHETKVGERERLSTLVEALEREVAVANGVEAEAEFRKRYDTKATANHKLAARITSDLAKANSIALAIARDVAKSEIEDRIINQSLPEDLAPLVSAQFLARGRAELPREDIKSERIWLWVRVDSGSLVSDQDAVIDHGGGKGWIPPHEARVGLMRDTGRPVQCIGKLFEQVSYHPAQSLERPVPLWQMRLVGPNGPNVEFDGSDLRQPSEVLLALERAAPAKPRKRPIEIELRPVASIRADGSSDDDNEGDL